MQAKSRVLPELEEIRSLRFAEGHFAHEDTKVRYSQLPVPSLSSWGLWVLESPADGAGGLPGGFFQWVFPRASISFVHCVILKSQLFPHDALTPRCPHFQGLMPSPPWFPHLHASCPHLHDDLTSIPYGLTSMMLTSLVSCPLQLRDFLCRIREWLICPFSA